MSCKTEGATHHRACDCREAYLQKLEAVAMAAGVLRRRVDQEKSQPWPGEVDNLFDALDDLNEKP